MQRATIWDAWQKHQITGKLVKEYPDGITIDDHRDVRHFAKTPLIIRIFNDAVEPPAWEKGLLF